MEPHAFAAYEGRIARVYLDVGYRRLTAWKGQVISSNLQEQNRLRGSIGAFFASARRPDEAGLLIDDWLTTWLDESESGPPCDPRVTAVLAYLDGQEAPLSADRKGLAKKVGLSPTRLAAIFAEDTGMPLSRYLIWRRVKIALARICAGESVTHAAAEAGFADGAHFTRSCRATYGSSPSNMVGFSIMPISHVAFAEPTIPDQHVCLAPHDTARSS